MSFTASLHIANLEGEPATLILTGESDGKSRPTWTFGKPVSRDRARSWEAVLMEHYDAGLYGTGSVGEVRDMIFAMSRVAEEFDVLLVVPEKTEERVKAEAAAEDLPAGAVH